MSLLRLTRDDGTNVGALNWYAVHGTSMSQANLLQSSDNKGFAAQRFERDFRRRLLLRQDLRVGLQPGRRGRRLAQSVHHRSHRRRAPRTQRRSLERARRRQGRFPEHAHLRLQAIPPRTRSLRPEQRDPARRDLEPDHLHRFQSGRRRSAAQLPARAAAGEGRLRHLPARPRRLFRGRRRRWARAHRRGADLHQPGRHQTRWPSCCPIRSPPFKTGRFRRASWCRSGATTSLTICSATRATRRSPFCFPWASRRST